MGQLCRRPQPDRCRRRRRPRRPRRRCCTPAQGPAGLLSSCVSRGSASCCPTTTCRGACLPAAQRPARGPAASVARPEASATCLSTAQRTAGEALLAAVACNRHFHVSLLCRSASCKALRPAQVRQRRRAAVPAPPLHAEAAACGLRRPPQPGFLWQRAKRALDVWLPCQPGAPVTAGLRQRLGGPASAGVIKERDTAAGTLLHEQMHIAARHATHARQSARRRRQGGGRVGKHFSKS